MLPRLSLLTLCLTCVLPTVAAAQTSTDAPASTGSAPSASTGGRGFGSAGVLSIANDASAQFGYLNVGGTGFFVFTLLPAADYFVVDRISVGGAIGFQFISGNNTSASNFILEPRVGYALPLSERLTLWPRGGVMLSTGSASVAGFSGNSSTRFGIAASAPLLFHAAEHFYFGGGPSLRADLTGDTKTTSFTLDFILGGWL